MAGRVEYFYARNGAWQVTQGEMEIYYFRNGQKEIHLGGGVKEVVYPDGSCYQIQDGKEAVASLRDISDALRKDAPSIYVA